MAPYISTNQDYKLHLPINPGGHIQIFSVHRSLQVARGAHVLGRHGVWAGHPGVGGVSSADSAPRRSMPPVNRLTRLMSFPLMRRSCGLNKI